VIWTIAAGTPWASHLQAGAAAVERAEEQRRDDDADRVQAADQRDRDRLEAIAGREPFDQPSADAEHLHRAAEAGEGATHRHGEDHDPLHVHAEEARRPLAASDGAEVQAERGARNEEPGGHHGEHGHDRTRV
jgi:hypothetical protein